jgi:hypothetical protein
MVVEADPPGGIMIPSGHYGDKVDIDYTGTVVPQMFLKSIVVDDS